MRWSAIYYTGYALALGQIERVVVDTTVQEKAITHPTDARLIHRAIEKLARLAHYSPPTANLAVKGITTKSGIQKCKKTETRHRLSCKIQYLSGSNRSDQSTTSKYFTDDFLFWLGNCCPVT